jgi:predicted nuclease of predicted toxin-antitoxin system
LIRLLADENVPRRSVALLREAGFDVAVAASGADDEAVLARAAFEHRVLVTLDRDFGRLALERGPVALPGVVYLRLRSLRPEACGMALLPLLRDPTVVLEGRFTVLRAARFRQRSLRPQH